MKAPISNLTDLLEVCVGTTIIQRIRENSAIPLRADLYPRFQKSPSIYMRFEVITAVTMRNAVFWDVASCRSCVNRRFRGTLLQSAATCSRWLLARGFFYPEDGGDTFLRNVSSHKTYTELHSQKTAFFVFHLVSCRTSCFQETI
jgi:hypothetical protein